LKAKVFTRGATALIIFGILCGLAACLAPSGGPQEPAWFCIIPPVLALLFAYLPSSLGLAAGWSFVLAFFAVLSFLFAGVRPS
jgi:hypothetical protein